MVLSPEVHNELFQFMEAMCKDSPYCTAMSFQTAEYYAKNSAIAMGLRFHLQDNLTPKKRLLKKARRTRHRRRTGYLG